MSGAQLIGQLDKMNDFRSPKPNACFQELYWNSRKKALGISGMAELQTEVQNFALKIVFLPEDK